MEIKPLAQMPILGQSVDKTTRNAFIDVHSRVNQLIKWLGTVSQTVLPHKDTHKTGGSDALTPADIGAAPLIMGVPPGAVMAFARSTPPDGWLECNGQAVSRTTYAALFAAIGTTFGAGDGSTTFNLPHLNLNDLVSSGAHMDYYDTDPIANGRFTGLTGTWIWDNSNKKLKQTDTTLGQHWGVEKFFYFRNKFLDFEFDMTINSDPSNRKHAGAFIQTVDGQITGYRITYLDNNFLFSKWSAGVETSLTCTTVNASTIVVGTQYHLRVMHDFTTGDGKLYMDNLLRITWHDTTYAQGRPGFHNYGCEVSYDNLVLNDLLYCIKY